MLECLGPAEVEEEGPSGQVYVTNGEVARGVEGVSGEGIQIPGPEEADNESEPEHQQGGRCCAVNDQHLQVVPFHGSTSEGSSTILNRASASFPIKHHKIGAHTEHCLEGANVRLDAQGQACINQCAHRSRSRPLTSQGIHAMPSTDGHQVLEGGSVQVGICLSSEQILIPEMCGCTIAAKGIRSSMTLLGASP